MPCHRQKRENREVTVLIEVEYENGACGFVMPETLDGLLGENKIIGFRRATGWTAVGYEPIRENERKQLSGAERRRRDALYRVDYV